MVLAQQVQVAPAVEPLPNTVYTCHWPFADSSLVIIPHQPYPLAWSICESLPKKQFNNVDNRKSKGRPVAGIPFKSRSL